MSWEQILTLLRLVHETATNPDPRFRRFHDEAVRRLGDVADVEAIVFTDELRSAEAEE